MKVRVLCSLGVLMVCVGLAPAGEGILVRMGLLSGSGENETKMVVQDSGRRLPDPVKPKVQQAQPSKGEPIPAPKTEITPPVTPMVPTPAPSNAVTPIPTVPSKTVTVPVTPIPVTVAENTGCCNCATESRGDCLDRLCEWACFRINKADCGKGCEPCCRPPLYVYFLDQCVGCKPIHPPVTSCHPAIAVAVAPLPKPAPPAFAPSPNKQGVCTNP